MQRGSRRCSSEEKSSDCQLLILCSLNLFRLPDDPLDLSTHVTFRASGEAPFYFYRTNELYIFTVRGGGNAIILGTSVPNRSTIKYAR